MTITSKPSDGDSIIEVQSGLLGNDKYVPTRALITFFDDLVNNIGPSAGSSSEIYSVDSYLKAQLSKLLKQPWLFIDVSEQTTDYTTAKTETVIALSNITVSLNDKPNDGERVIVKRATTDGDVVVSAQSKTIDGDSSYTMLVNYEGIQCVYSLSRDGWFII